MIKTSLYDEGISLFEDVESMLRLNYQLREINKELLKNTKKLKIIGEIQMMNNATNNRRAQMMDSLAIVYEKDGFRILGIRVADEVGQENVRLSIEVDGELRDPLSFKMSQLDTKVFDVSNFGKKISYIEIMEICNCITRDYETWNVIPYTKGIGWQYDKDKNITGFNGAIALDDKGNKKLKDTEVYGLTARGNFELYVDELKKYLNTPLRQAVYIAGVASILGGLLDKNIIVNINGKSRTGKTTLAKLALSAFSSVDDMKLYKDFNGTENSILNSMEDINGCCVLIDDTSLKVDELKNFTKFIYALESGREKKRLRKNSKIKEDARWRATTILTSEESILFNCDFDKEGVAGRFIEFAPTAKELFDSAKQANSIQKLCKENYGLLAPEFVEFLLKKDYVAKIKEIYQKEVEEIRIGITDTQLSGIAEKVGIITLTGKLLNEAFEFDFDIGEVTGLLLELSEENLGEYREEQKDTYIIEEVYPKLIKFGQNEFKEHIREDGIWINGKALTKYLRDNTEFKSKEVRNALNNRGLLVSNTRTTAYNITYNKKSLTGICIKPVEGEVLAHE